MGTPGKRAPSDEVLRQALHRAWKSGTSLAKHGKAMKLSPPGVLKIIREGTDLQHLTRNKLLLWYAEERAGVDGLPLAIAELFYERLLPGLPDATRAEFLGELAARARAAYEKQGVPPPHWLDELDEE